MDGLTPLPLTTSKAVWTTLSPTPPSSSDTQPRSPACSPSFPSDFLTASILRRVSGSSDVTRNVWTMSIAYWL